MTLLFLDLGTGEVLIIILAIFLIFGPGKIPEMARSLGKFIGEIKRASEDVKNEINREADRIEREEKLKEYKKKLDLEGESQQVESKPDVEVRKTKKPKTSAKKKAPKADIIQEDAETGVKEIKRQPRKTAAAKKTTKTAGKQTKATTKPGTTAKGTKSPSRKPKTVTKAKTKPAEKTTGTTARKPRQAKTKTKATSTQEAKKVTQAKKSETAKPIKRTPQKES